MLQNPPCNACVNLGTPFWRVTTVLGRGFSRHTCARPNRAGVRTLALRSARARRCVCLLSLGAQLSVQTLKHRLSTVVGTQPQHPAPRMLDHASGLEHQLLQHRLHAPSLGRVAHRRILAKECVLPDQAQDIHGHRSQGTHQLFGLKLATRQALQVQIGLK